ncbi:MAG: Mechanosensitive channel MscK [Burkholderia plantarii]|nr:MAG: Mechanosensitive channel MscK [Burkholderia plantarii]
MPLVLLVALLAGSAAAYAAPFAASATIGAAPDAPPPISAEQLGTEVDKLIDALTPERAQLQAQLDVLGPPPAAGAAPETPAVARQRVLLNAKRDQYDAALKQAVTEKSDLANLDQQFAKLRRGVLRDQLALRSGSLFGSTFWGPFLNPLPDDSSRLRGFAGQFGALVAQQWQAPQRVVTLLLLALSIALWSAGRRLLERGFAWLCLNRLPETRLRRSALALTTALSTVISTAFAVQLLYLALMRGLTPSPALEDFADGFAKLALTCALIAGLGRALLCTRHPTWRLPALADPVASAMRRFPAVLAALLLVSGTLEQLNRIADTSLQVTLLGRGLVSLVVALTIGASLLRANRARAELAAAGEPPERRSTLTGLIHAGVTLAVIASLVALVIGYITVARFITYELVWFEIVLCSFFVLTQLTRDVCASLFSTSHASGNTIKHLFGLDDSHLEQAATLLSRIGVALLVLLAALALLTGGFGTTPTDLFDSLLTMLGGTKLRSLNIVPEHLVNALVALAVGICVLRAIRRWLDHEFLPTLGMDPGMRASLVTLFGNLGYVLLVLMTLSLVGVQWSSLAWIVSALSVGIGFGLQEIVKNFVSGLILLTERPVKVGDMVSISGVEGDIRRINVRATEIQLTDRSTVIVPNSQLISQNLRNVTMGNSTQGVATLMLTFPLNTDPEQVRDLLLDAFRAHPAVLEKPAPSVTFSQLTPDGITLSVTGYVSSPRITTTVKSDLLFEILKQLRAASIMLSSPQMLMIQNAPGAPATTATTATTGTPPEA